MKIAQNTHDRLVLTQRPWLLAGITLVLGLAAGWEAVFATNTDSLVERALIAALAAGTLTVSWYFFPFTHSEFDRPAGMFVHRERRLTGTRQFAIPLAQIKRAQVESEWSDGARLARLALVLPDRRFALEHGFGAQERRAVEDAVNEWLTRPPRVD